ncbi:MAG: efflux RND transporter periplasmic adaptor subunit, partial [Acidobacteriota bacterium]|nr:efflux RND transporter periplasmic adaptor subunit [Acidobacteriota bacterium]
MAEIKKNVSDLQFMVDMARDSAWQCECSKPKMKEVCCFGVYYINDMYRRYVPLRWNSEECFDRSLLPADAMDRPCARRGHGFPPRNDARKTVEAEKLARQKDKGATLAIRHNMGTMWSGGFGANMEESKRELLKNLRIERDAAPRRRPRFWLPVSVVILAVAVIGIGWRFASSGSAASVRTITVRESVAQGAATVLNASGYVTARRQATVSSKVTGRVTEVFIEEGMRVEEGQVLARLDASNVQASYSLANAQLRAARSAVSETKVLLAEAELHLGRTRRLAAEEVASAYDLDEAVAAADTLKARLERQREEIEVANRQVQLWNQQLEDLTIRAPFTGIVVAKNAQPGEMISPVSAGGGFTRTGIGTIVDMDSLEIEVDVGESYIGKVLPEQRVDATLDAYPSWKIPARVIAIIPTADRQKATVKVRIGFDELDERVLPDMGVKVAFRGAAESQPGAPRIEVPETAIRRVDGRNVVFVVNEGKLERRSITLGDQFGDRSVVAAGLA